MEPRLVVVSGASKGTIARLNNVEMTIGRDPDNGLCLNEDDVSRKHCTIKSDSGIYRILDLNSRNGTFVNSIPVREKILQLDCSDDRSRMHRGVPPLSLNSEKRQLARV